MFIANVYDNVVAKLIMRNWVNLLFGEIRFYVPLTAKTISMYNCEYVFSINCIFKLHVTPPGLTKINHKIAINMLSLWDLIVLNLTN